MNKNFISLSFYFFIFLFLSCNLNEMNRIEESEKKTYLNLKNFLKKQVLKETSTKNAIKRGSVFYIDTEDIKKIDGITVDAAVLPSAVGSPSFRHHVGGRGLSNLTISATDITKNDNAGTYAYTANLEKHGEKRTLAISYTGYKNTLTAAQERDLSRLNNFTEAEIKSMDDITVDGAVLPPSKDPTFTRKNLHGFGDTEYTMSLVAGTKSKNDAAGIYSYRVRLSSVATSQTRDVDILYSGFLTAAQKILNDDHLNIASFSDTDLKQWDGITSSMNTLASTLTPNFTLPSTHNGLSNFKVQVLGSPFVDDGLGTYKYIAEVTNASGKVRKVLVVSYVGSFNPTIYRNMGEAQSMTGHTGNIYKTLFTSDMTKIVSSAADSRVRIWDVATGASLKELTLTGRVKGLDISPDGSKILAGSTSGHVKMWNMTGTLIKDFEKHPANVNSVTFSPDKEHFLTSSYNYYNMSQNVTYKWKLSDLNNYIYKKHSNGVTDMVYSPTDSGITFGHAGMFNYTIKKYDFSSNSDFSTIKSTTFTSSYQLIYVGVSLDGTKLAASSVAKKKVTLYTTEKLTKWKDITTTLAIYSSKFSPDGTKLVGASKDHKIYIWNVADGTLIKTLTGHTNDVNYAEFSPDGRWIVSGSDDYSVKIWK